MVVNAINHLRKSLLKDINMRKTVEYKLRKTNTTIEKQNKLKTNQAQLADIMRGTTDIKILTTDIISYMAEFTGARIGTLYVVGDDNKLHFKGSYGCNRKQKPSSGINIGEGMVGQVVKEKRMIVTSDLPENYVKITSSLGSAVPRHVIVFPVILHENVVGVMELGSFSEFSDDHIEFINLSSENIAIAIDASRSHEKLEALLEKTESQREELNDQKIQLEEANLELEEQTQLLSASENTLKQQREELQVSNEELEEKTEYLERNKKEIEEKNRRLEIFQSELNKKAEDLAAASRYKSEFLANMSHELRTPLNSLLLLAKMLSENRKKNLEKDQLESADIIYKSGRDLLSLINEILDLSKIEAGKMIINIHQFTIEDIRDSLTVSFKHMADKKGLEFSMVIHENCPARISSDYKKVEQILKNLISNAIKFTEKGRIQIEFFQPDSSMNLSHLKLKNSEMVAVSVKDTGIGIPDDKASSIFAAFQQAEGGISRKYGGTGLGLSISKEFAKLLGGEIQLESTPGKGSQFTLFLPVFLEEKVTPEADESISAEPEVQPLLQTKLPDPDMIHSSSISDDRDTVTKKDKSVLIIEDDLDFGKILLKLCREKGFKSLYSETGENGLLLAEKYQPGAVILDIRLPGMDGWAVLDALKTNPVTRHIPVHFMSVEEPLFDTFNRGAIGYLTKPVSSEKLDELLGKLDSIISKKERNLLIVEDNDAQRKAITALIGNSDVVTDEARTGKEAIKALLEKEYDCMILDLGLPDMSGFELLEKLKKTMEHPVPPVIVYTGKDLSLEQENMLRTYSESIIIKGVRSEERLLDEASLFLHRVVEKMPSEKKKIIADIYSSDSMMSGKNILIVDDDMRNVFALSKILSEKSMNIIKAENGKKALSILNARSDIDLVLMDIMMPVMDGYETMKKIRQNREFANLPIIALTAKAMKQDKAKCIQAGANDYLAKPIDIDRLLSMIRVWLYR